MSKEQGFFIEEYKDVLGLTWRLEQVYGNVGEVTIASSKQDR